MARILIAEDEETLRALCARALATDGHEVKTACDGSDALDLLEREAVRFDLLLTDIRMPIMDGIALALTAARECPDLTILLMTGYADQRERAHGLDAIIHDVIAKPFSVAALRAAVTEALTVRGRELISPSFRRRIRPRQRLRRQIGMRPAEIGRGRILADLHDAAPDRARSREMGEQCFAIAAADGARRVATGLR